MPKTLSIAVFLRVDQDVLTQYVSCIVISSKVHIYRIVYLYLTNLHHDNKFLQGSIEEVERGWAWRGSAS